MGLAVPGTGTGLHGDQIFLGLHLPLGVCPLMHKVGAIYWHVLFLGQSP